jgi:phosphatidylglycerophosphate synthase
MKKIIVFSWVIAAVIILIFFPEYTKTPSDWYGLYEAVYKIGAALFIPLFLVTLIVGIPYLLYDFLKFLFKKKNK